MEQLAEILQVFDLDPYDLPMVVLGMALFTVLWRVLDRGLFKPYIALLDAREALTDGAESTATETIEKAESIKAEFDAKVLEARTASMQERFERVGSANSQATKVVEEATEKSQQKIADARSERESQFESLRQSVLKDAEKMASDVVSKVGAVN